MSDESRKPLNQWSIDSKTSSNGFIDFAKHAGKIIAWPFIALISVLSTATGFLSGVGKAVAGTPTWVNKKISDLILRHQRKKAWKKLSRLLGGVLLVGSPMMHNLTLGGIVGVLAFMLQCISFFTTYGGTTYYFYDIGAWVPVFLAFVIQATILLFSFSLDTKTRNRWPKWIVLTLAVCVSILFSFVGIINNTIEPYYEHAETYDSLRSELTVLAGRIKNDTTKACSPIDAANIVREEIINSIQCYNATVSMLAYAEAVESNNNEDIEATYKSFLDDLAAAIIAGLESDNNNDQSNVSIDFAGVNTTPSERTDYPKIASSSLEPAKEELVRALQAVGITSNDGIYDASTIDIKSISSYMDVYPIDESQDSLWNFLNYHTRYDALVKAHNNCANAMINAWSVALSDTNVDMDNFNFPESFQGEYVSSEEMLAKLKLYSEIEKFEMRTSEEIITATLDYTSGSSTTTPQNDTIAKIISFIKNLLQINTSSQKKYTDVVNGFQTDARAAYDLLDVLMTADDKSQNSWSDINKIYNKLFEVSDSSIIAFERLADKNTNKRTIVPLILAILVDGGTVLISWAGRKKRYSSLYANTNRDYYEEEMDLFEQVFVSAAGIESIKDADLLQKASDPNVFCDIVAKAVDIIHDYLSKFIPSPETVDLGCALRIVVEDAQKANYCGLTSLLLTMGYLCPIDDRQLILLRTGHLPKSCNEQIQNYYCIKFNAESYLRQCMTNTNLYIYYYLERIFHPKKSKKP